MAAISCPNCGADLTVPQSVRIAEYHFGRLEKVDLWEISVVTFPMLPQARVSVVKTARPLSPVPGF